MSPRPPRRPGGARCKKCGAVVRARARICPRCGRVLDPPVARCANCRAPVLPRDRVCPRCGKPLAPPRR